MARRYGEPVDDERWTSSSGHEIQPWKFAARTGTILYSNCRSSRIGGCDPQSPAGICNVCLYRCELPGLPVLPEMVFPTNYVRVEHVCGAKVEFNALDALKMVSTTEEPLQVAGAVQWRRSRRYLQHHQLVEQEMQKVVKPFDWTYTTKYRGTVLSNNNGDAFMVEETNQQIDFEKLKKKEKIEYWDETILYEDELGDNGVAKYNVKIRAMNTCFLALGRFFLRVDGVLVRINDTRLYHEMGTNFMLREYTSKEAKMEELLAAHSFLADPEKLTPFVPTIETVREKLVVPDVKLVPRKITAEKLYYYHFEKGDEELMDPSERGKSNNRTETKK